jgi:transcriptional regulator with XRE-family HTH domain
MKEQIIKIMEEKGLSAAQFADILNIQRPRLSHILNERNKPGYDFIYTLLEKFPDINASWLITGKGSMYNQASESIDNLESNSNSKEDNSDLFTNAKPKINEDKEEIHDNLKSNNKISKELTNVNSIEKIIILYTDKTFTTYKPQ